MSVETIKNISLVVGIPILRSIAGWANNALEDGKIEAFEIKKLLATVVRVGGIAIVGYLGLNSLGFDVSAVAATAGAYIADWIFKAIKK